MDFTGLRVLVIDSGKQSLAMIRGLKEIGCHVTVICGSKKSINYVSNQQDKKIVNEHIHDHDDWAITELLKLLKTREYDVVMPISELGTNFATQHEEEIKQYSHWRLHPLLLLAVMK